MAIAFECSGCSKRMSAGDDAAGRKAKCKACGVVTHVPRPLVLEEGERRDHHYDFAHGFLPHMSFRGGMGVGTLLAMASDAKGALLRMGWESVGSSLPQKDRLPPDGLRATLVEPAKDLALAVIQLPPARRSPEALFVAGCYDQRGGSTSFRFLTLELGLDLATLGPRTVLGEWLPSADGGPPAHGNLGTGPPDSREAFVAACLRLLDER
jgi:hypothetical protein